MRDNQQFGYSIQLAAPYNTSDIPTYSVSVRLVPQYKWENHRPTEEVIGFKAMFIRKGLDEPLIVKFSKEIELPAFLSVVELENLMACSVKGRLYFKADGLKVKGER